MLKEPESMDECLYFTNRTIGELGKAKAWVYKKMCPKCGETKMGKPVEKGKVRIRAKEYVCSECGHIEEKKEHIEANIFIHWSNVKTLMHYPNRKGFDFPYQYRK